MIINAELKADFVLYRELLADPLLRQSLQEPVEAAAFYADLCRCAAEQGWQGEIFPLHLLDRMVACDNAFSRAASLQPLTEIAPPLRRLAEAELAQIVQWAGQPLPQLGEWADVAAAFPLLKRNHNYGLAYERFLGELAAAVREQSAAWFVERLAAFHYRFGYGSLVRYTFLSWQDQGLCGVPNADTVTLDELFAYERQKQQVFANTGAFLAGKPANNLLLYGEKGTGKSSLVKAVVNHFAAKGLRLIYLPRQYWGQLGSILYELSAYRQRFIVFLDDFSFDAQEADYKQIKSVIEGGAAVKPDNLLLYATSNRRHLVAESWLDREDKHQDMYLADTVSEKLALSDRFGLTITFPPPSQDEYLEIVAGIAALEGVQLSPEQLKAQAVRWERWYNARSGRTARQFINNLLCQD